MRDVPLRRQREVIVAPASEIALLPPAAVCERDIGLRECQHGIRPREVGDDRVGMLARVTHDIGHPCLPPAVIDFLVTGLAGGRADVMGLDSMSRRRAVGGTKSGCRRQVAEEGDDLPNLVFRQIPGRHRGVAYAVADVGENLAVCKRRERLAKGRRARIDMLADGCAAGSVKAVADRALLLKRRRASSDNRFVGLQRIGPRGGRGRHAVQQSQVATSVSITPGVGRALESPGRAKRYKATPAAARRNTATRAIESLRPISFSSPASPRCAWSYRLTTATVLSAAATPVCELKRIVDGSVLRRRM